MEAISQFKKCILIGVFVILNTVLFQHVSSADTPAFNDALDTQKGAPYDEDISSGMLSEYETFVMYSPVLKTVYFIGWPVGFAIAVIFLLLMNFYYRNRIKVSELRYKENTFSKEKSERRLNQTITKLKMTTAEKKNELIQTIEDLKNSTTEKVNKLTKKNKALKSYLLKEKQVIQHLHTRIERYQWFSEASNEGILLCQNGKKVEANDILTRLFGIAFHEIDEKDPLKKLISPDHVDVVKKKVGGEKNTSFDILGMKRDGTQFPIEVEVKTIYLRDNTFEAYIFRDISERKFLENQLRNTHKMKIISSLSSGIAYRFNQALDVISEKTVMMKNASDEKSVASDIIEPIMDVTNELKDMSVYLQAYAQEPKQEKQTFSFSSFIKKALDDMVPDISPDIHIETDLPDKMAEIEGDRSLLTLMLSAVVRNAVEAIDGKGRIDVICKYIFVDRQTSKKLMGINPGPYIHLQVKDDGKGIEKNVLPHIFEPFFTTHCQGRGLGLPAVYGVITSHKGQILIESESGHGAEVNIYLPASYQHTQDTRQIKRIPYLGTGNILLIEDEDDERKASRSMIEKLGYHVLTAETARDAIQIVNDTLMKIDLILLDDTLPDMNGKKLYSKIMQKRPNVNVIACGKKVADDGVQNLLNVGAHSFLQKPFKYQELSVAIESAIEKRKYPRFKTISGIVTLPDVNLSKQFKMIDISKGGTVFYYFENTVTQCDFSSLSISSSDNKFFLEDIPCKVISNQKMNNILSLNRERVKRLAVQFGPLATEQEKKVGEFIEKYAVALSG